MKFKEKIDKILKVNTLGINSVSALEDYVGASRSAINEFYNKNRDPGRKTLKKILALPKLNLTWWETGEGDVFCNVSEEKPTHAQNEPAITSKDDMNKGFTGTNIAEINLNTALQILSGVREDAARYLSDAERYRAEVIALRKENDELKKQLLKRSAASNNIKE